MKNEEWRLQDVNQKHKAGYLLKSMLLQHESVTKLYKDLTNQKKSKSFIDNIVLQLKN